VDLYSAIFAVPYTEGAQLWITQFYPQITVPHTCLYLVSIHQMAPPLSGDGVHLVAAYYSSIDPKRMKGWVGLVG